MPITWSARAVAPAILVSEIDEVLLARIASGLHSLSSCAKISVQLREDIELERFVLGRCFDHDIDIGQFFQRGRGFDIDQRCLLVGSTYLFFLDQALETSRDGV
jgi:hypothetical protein